MKKNFTFDFGNDNVISFSPYNLGELRQMAEKMDTIMKAGAESAMRQVSDMLPFMTAAAQRATEGVTQEKLEALLDMFNFQEVFQGALANSYPENAKGGALPVQ